MPKQASTQDKQFPNRTGRKSTRTQNRCGRDHHVVNAAGQGCPPLVGQINCHIQTRRLVGKKPLLDLAEGGSEYLHFNIGGGIQPGQEDPHRLGPIGGIGINNRRGGALGQRRGGPGFGGRGGFGGGGSGGSRGCGGRREGGRKGRRRGLGRGEATRGSG